MRKSRGAALGRRRAGTTTESLACRHGTARASAIQRELVWSTAWLKRSPIRVSRDQERAGKASMLFWSFAPLLAVRPDCKHAAVSFAGEELQANLPASLEWADVVVLPGKLDRLPLPQHPEVSDDILGWETVRLRTRIVWCMKTADASEGRRRQYLYYLACFPTEEQQGLL